MDIKEVLNKFYDKLKIFEKKYLNLFEIFK